MTCCLQLESDSASELSTVVTVCFDRTALENLQAEHQRALQHVVESKDKELDAVTRAKDHAR